ncbi:TPA: glycosyltransferase [Klebsiella quasipneumoniae subsp. quasipneumoniae]|uniref:glycosyltransferase n=1 Tax=Klebsiella quasipneumoniae TaxID=1463165 RepID=UPI0015BE3E3D|nr:glycosyltransferase [Klebsiella quasipneumoniae]HBQ6650849.1 glycosyltransferase [Klebsiella quasipneumoniae subsp. quasipneumoniae]NWM02783.1 glycosyltransferase [Klebsiella quasipneumoniae]HBR1510969.1 glycosyltransferase [Klebsiella quasipneumoniae subsp. quasipneumoniae]HBR1953911.1 glycosyltransferase [Klebsiella quasipneumoniae subsp. quasipneumoniae]HCI6220527.1 glycosyltransferase [Klebsiella quasipneumoniae subsp. quasipneumoniae]
MKENPLVTIYIPTFNRIELLKRALNSVVNQTYENLEIIVVDDNSSDGTQEFLKNFSKKDPRVSYILKTDNSGACVSRNLAIDKANGLFITGLDDDDYFSLNRIEQLMDKSHLLNKYVFLYTYYLTVVAGGKYKKVRYLNSILPTTITGKELLHKNIIGNQCFTYTKRLRDAGKFSPDMPAWQDMELFYRLLTYSELNEAYLINMPLYFQDTSHDKNRITLSNKQKIYNAFEVFCQRNNIQNREREILKAQLISYGIKIEYSSLFKRFIGNTNIYSCLVDMFLLIKNMGNEKIV